MTHPHSPLHAQCPYCHVAISVHQKIRPGHCDNPNCNTAHAIKGEELRQARLLEEYREQIALAKDAFAQPLDAALTDNGIAAERVHMGAVPYSDVPLTPLPEDRREAYLANLTKITEQAFALPAPEPQDVERDYISERAEPFPWNNTACGTCQGHCCQTQGAKSYAFQTVEVITHLRQQQPEVTAPEVIAFYTDALPEVSNDGGCVFQGPVGCVLHRSKRADICNKFRCYALRRLATDIDPAATDAVALLSVEWKTPQRMALFVTGVEPGEGAENPHTASTG